MRTLNGGQPQTQTLHSNSLYTAHPAQKPNPKPEHSSPTPKYTTRHHHGHLKRGLLQPNSQYATTYQGAESQV